MVIGWLYMRLLGAKLCIQKIATKQGQINKQKPPSRDMSFLALATL